MTRRITQTSVLATLLMSSVVAPAQARPLYLKEIVNVYPKESPRFKFLKCSVCHFGKRKKNRNPYGKALEKALGKKNVKNREKIHAALRKIGPPKIEVKPMPVTLRSLTLPARLVGERRFATSIVTVAAVQQDVADVKSEKRVIATKKRMTYFLIPAADKKPPKAGYGLIVLLPGGSGGAGFHPFIKRIRKHAVPSDVIVAQPIAVKWTDGQRIIWPTEHNKVDKQEFSTEAFIDAVIKDVGSVHNVDPKRTWAMGWSSSGSAIYAAALRKKTPIAGSYIMMSVYKPKYLPPVKNAKGRKFYIEHSPHDRVCPHWMAKKASAELKAAGAMLTFSEYKRGHGFRGNVYGRLRKGIQWLEGKSKK